MEKFERTSDGWQEMRPVGQAQEDELNDLRARHAVDVAAESPILADAVLKSLAGPMNWHQWQLASDRLESPDGFRVLGGGVLIQNRHTGRFCLANGATLRSCPQRWAWNRYLVYVDMLDWKQLTAHPRGKGPRLAGGDQQQ